MSDYDEIEAACLVSADLADALMQSDRLMDSLRLEIGKRLFEELDAETTARFMNGDDYESDAN